MHKKGIRRLWGLIAACLILGCGTEEKEPEREMQAPKQEEPQESAAAISIEALGGTARLSGVVRFKGELPESREIRVSGDSYCVAAHGKSLVEPDVIVDATGHVQNVFVYITSGLPEGRFTVPQAPVIIDQKDCMYEPRVVGVQVGQTLQFRNSDQTLHNVHAVTNKKLGNKGFNFGMSSRLNVSIERKFKAPEIMVRIKCDVHPWMVSWVGVLPHSWYAVSDSQGRFALAQLPPGDYVVAAWHERFGSTTATVQVEEGASAVLDILFEASSGS